VDLQSIMAVQTMTTIPTQNAIQPQNTIQKQKAAEPTTEIPTQKTIEPTAQIHTQNVLASAPGVQTQTVNSYLGLSAVNTTRSTKTHDIHTLKHNVPVPPLRLQQPAESSIEETLRLLLHAVRIGVEVLAQAKRVELAPWPEAAQEEDAVTPTLPFNPSTTSLEKPGSGKDNV